MSEVRITKEEFLALRERSGAGILDCLKALRATNGDQDKAFEYLKEIYSDPSYGHLKKMEGNYVSNE